MAPNQRVPGHPPAPRFGESLPRGAHVSSLPVQDVSAIGTRTNGKIFAGGPGFAYTCSGTAINTPSRSVVLTAGHCILDGGVRAAHLSFVPAYDHGHRPFGTFHATSTRVMERWRVTESTSMTSAR